MARMRELLRVLRCLSGAALAIVLMGLHAPAFAAGVESPVLATPHHDCAAMPAGSCADMAACAERLPPAVDAPQARQPAMQIAAPDTSPIGRERGAVHMPAARIARYGPPAYLKFRSLLL